MADRAGPFDPRAVLVLALISGGAFILALLAGILIADRSAPSTAGSNVFSESALGHKALAELLEGAGLSVHVMQGGLPKGLWSRHLLLIAEPPLDYLEQVLDRLDADDKLAILVVLPKREGFIKDTGDRWIAASRLLPVSAIQPFLDILNIEGSVLRLADDAAITEVWTGRVEGLPEIADPQVIRSDDLTALISGDGGILFGRITSRDINQIYVLSDPDLIANHGLDDGDNAVLVAQLADYFVGDRGVVLIDAAAHGFGRRTDLWQMFFKPPLVVVTLSLLALATVLFLIGWRRLGPIAPETDGMAAGTAGLIETMAGWLAMPGRRRDLMQAYLDVAAHDRRRGGAAEASDDGLDDLQRAVGRCQPGLAADKTVRLARSIDEWRRGEANGGRERRQR